MTTDRVLVMRSPVIFLSVAILSFLALAAAVVFQMLEMHAYLMF